MTFQRNWFKPVEPAGLSFLLPKGIPITGGILKAKTADYASSLHIEGFKVSNGWLGSWKGRHDVKQFKWCRGADVDKEVVDDELQKQNPKHYTWQEWNRGVWLWWNWVIVLSHARQNLGRKRRCS